MKQAVCLLVRHPNNKSILGVNRERKSGVRKDWGLPGGKVEPGETLEQAVIRETREETGNEISNPKFIFSAICPGPTPYDVTVFEVPYHNDMVSKSSEEGICWWELKEAFVARHTAFACYNRLLFKHVGLKIDEEIVRQLSMRKNECKHCGRVEWVEHFYRGDNDFAPTDRSCDECDKFTHHSPSTVVWVRRVVAYQIRKALVDHRLVDRKGLTSL